MVSVLPSSFPLVLSLCVANKWSMPLKGTCLFQGSVPISFYLYLCLSCLCLLYVLNLMSSPSIFRHSLSLSLPPTYMYIYNIFFCLSCADTHEHTQTHMETCTHADDDPLSWLAVPMAMASLSVCTADTQIQRGKERRGEDSLIDSYLSMVQVHPVHGQFLGIF